MSEELILSPADPQWHERRREVYTASDMGVLFGFPGFAGRTLSDVWFEKRYGLKEDKSTASTRLGQKMESIILDEAETTLGPIVNRQEWRVKGQIGATLDGLCQSDGRPVEAKTSGLLWKPDQEWGDVGDEVPSAIVLQVLAQILVTDADLGYVPAIIGGRGFMLYEVPRADALIVDMQRRVTDFMLSLGIDEPPEAPPTLETLKRLKRQPNKIIPRSEEMDELKAQFEEAKETSKEADAAKEFLQRQILARLGDAEAADCTDGMFTYFEQSRKESFVSGSTFRVLRFKRG